MGRNGNDAAAALPIGTLIRDFLKTRGLSRQAFPLGLANAWAEAVGPAQAASTRVTALRGGILTVEVESSALRSELETFYREDLIERLKVLAPTCGVRRIAFRPKGRA